MTSLYLRHSSFSNPSIALPTSQLILQPFRRFTYVTARSPTLPLLFLRHSSFSNPSDRFTYVTAQSPTLPLLHLRHNSFSKPSFASSTSQALHLRHLESRPCYTHKKQTTVLKKSLVNTIQKLNLYLDFYGLILPWAALQVT